MPTDTMSAEGERQPTEEERQQEELAAAELVEGLAETAAAFTAAFNDVLNNPDVYNHELLSQYLPENADREELAPHAEDVCEGQNFNEEECQAQGNGCCFWENNACWAAIDGACPVANEEEPQEAELEEVNDEAPDLVTVIFVGLASVIMGSTCTYALFRPRSALTEKQLPLLTPA